MVGSAWGGVGWGVVGEEEIDRGVGGGGIWERLGERRRHHGVLAVPLSDFATNQHHRVLLLFLFDFLRTIYSFIPTLSCFLDYLSIIVHPHL